jgi:hypothetical protein
MQSGDGEEEEQASATPMPLRDTSSSSTSTGGDRPAAPVNLPALVPDEPESEPVELIRFRGIFPERFVLHDDGMINVNHDFLHCRRTMED